MSPDLYIRCREDLEKAVEEWGIVPFFRHSVPGFSIAERVDPALWFTDQPGPWEWKGPVIRNTGCAYGKFFQHKAAYISREWFYHFANWRRDGYDFDARWDEGLATRKEKYLYELLAAHAPILSKDLKELGGYGKEGLKGFDPTLARLQEQGYVTVSDFVYLTDKRGKPYGWGVAEYTTPEQLFGPDFGEKAYSCEPEESYEKILAHLLRLTGGDEAAVKRFLK